ncbi:unnamed protein product [Caenorhabditis brenneri]
MPRLADLMPFTDADLVPSSSQLTRKRKATSNSASPPSTSTSMDKNENTRPIEDYLTKKRTMPKQFCPKRRAPTQELAAPVTSTTRRPLSKKEDDAKLKNFLEERPHFRVERKLEAEESEDMKVLKAFRRRDFLAAQAAKATGRFPEEPKPKKRRTAVPKPFWMKN